jgi:KDEL-tailed cysteine endopeptidase
MLAVFACASHGDAESGTVNTSVAIQPEAYVEAFERFVKEFHKSYTSATDRARHFQAFKTNFDFIAAHRAAGHSYEVGLTPFADMTQEEFAEGYTNKRLGEYRMNFSGLPKLGIYKSQNLDIPDSVDWVKAGAVTDVKNQGQCGSCWSFATTGSAEGAWKIATNQLLSLSEQQLLDCMPPMDGQSGCDGGNPELAMKYLKDVPMCMESTYGYTAKGGSCKASSCSVAIPKGGVRGYKEVTANDEQALMEAVVEGPVAVSIHGSGQVFQLYKNGVLSQACDGPVNHAVLLVGYGVDGDQKYWKVKNSWGPTWGDHGYIRMARGSQTGKEGECKILSASVYAIVDGKFALWYYSVHWGLWFLLFAAIILVLVSSICWIKKQCKRKTNNGRTPFLNTRGATQVPFGGAAAAAAAAPAGGGTSASAAKTQMAVSGNSRASRLLQ